ncbi:MAG TPA: hypothetical protein VNS83_04805, partial [Lapillicoccus sp.]|nr:hypothetical protein [Lapillicoccus sp.]
KDLSPDGQAPYAGQRGGIRNCLTPDSRTDPRCSRALLGIARGVTAVASSGTALVGWSDLDQTAKPQTTFNQQE